MLANEGVRAFAKRLVSMKSQGHAKNKRRPSQSFLRQKRLYRIFAALGARKNLISRVFEMIAVFILGLVALLAFRISGLSMSVGSP
jgi:hypothetical protein